MRWAGNIHKCASKTDNTLGQCNEVFILCIDRVLYGCWQIIVQCKYLLGFTEWASLSSFDLFDVFFPMLLLLRHLFPIAPLAITLRRKRTMPETGMATGNHSSKLYTLNFSWPVNLMWWLQTVAFERFLSHDFYTKDMQSLHQNGNFVILNIKRYRDRQSAIGRSQVAISCLVECTLSVWPVWHLF